MALLQEFEKRFARLSVLDMTMLDMRCVLLFVKVWMCKIESKWVSYWRRMMGYGKESLQPFRQTARVER